MNETRDLGWLATVTAYCDSHQENETWGVKGDTAAEARDRIALAQEGIMGDHRLRQYIPSIGRIYSLPIHPQPPEPSPAEKAASVVVAELEHLSHDERLLVLLRILAAEETEPYGETAQTKLLAAKIEAETGLVPIPPCDGGQIP